MVSELPQIDFFKVTYTVLGGLAIFFFGMRNMSDGLQSIGSQFIRRLIHFATSNRFLAVLVGLGVTTIVQSSSVSTVMTVGLVNAGFMSLTQAIGVIFGANIGTTITGWIISIKIGKYGLLLLGLSVYPYLYAKSVKWKQFGRVLFGIGMIFFGLELMSDAFKPLRTSPGFLDLLSYFSGANYLSFLACAFLGCVLTIIIQSSSAMLGITIAMAVSGVIEFHTAAALVMGENIGTTITALLAAVGGNITAKRVARAHSLFNLGGVFIIFLFFPYYVEFIDWLVPGPANLVNAAGDHVNIAFHIASGHTIFNVTCTLLFLPFLNGFARFVTRITPEKESKEQFQLEMLGKVNEILPPTALVQANEEIKKLKMTVDDMFVLCKESLASSESNQGLIDSVNEKERTTDQLQKEVTLFITCLLEKSLTSDESNEALTIVRIADELESVGDYIQHVVNLNKRYHDISPLKKVEKEELLDLFQKVHAFYTTITQNFSTLSETHTVLYDQSDTIKHLANQNRENHIQRVGQGKSTVLNALIFSDMVVALRKTRSHSQNIFEAIQGRKSKHERDLIAHSTGV
jgi:phosphate:Na+ symporter